MSDKHLLKSSTFWAALVLMVVQKVFPSSKEWISANSAELLPMLGALMLALRLRTTSAVRIRRKASKCH